MNLMKWLQWRMSRHFMTPDIASNTDGMYAGMRAGIRLIGTKSRESGGATRGLGLPSPAIAVRVPATRP